MGIVIAGLQRGFARIAVRVMGRFSIVDAAGATALREELLSRPSVWAPEVEPGLLGLASGHPDDPHVCLARALLEISREITILKSTVASSRGPMLPAILLQLSGGGGRLSTELILEKGTLLDLTLQPNDDGAPPLRALLEIVHREGEPPAHYGFRFVALHPTDQDRLIRYLHQVQREDLRRHHGQKA